MINVRISKRIVRTLKPHSYAIVVKYYVCCSRVVKYYSIVAKYHAIVIKYYAIVLSYSRQAIDIKSQSIML